MTHTPNILIMHFTLTQTYYKQFHITFETERVIWCVKCVCASAYIDHTKLTYQTGATRSDGGVDPLHTNPRVSII